MGSNAANNPNEVYTDAASSLMGDYSAKVKMAVGTAAVVVASLAIL